MSGESVPRDGHAVEGGNRNGGPAKVPGTGRVAAGLLERVDELVAEYLARLWDDPELRPFAREELRERAREVAVADIRRELVALRDGELPLSCPPEVAASVAMAAEVGFPLSGVLHCYRTGHAVQWDAYAAAVDAAGLEEAERAAALREGSEFFFEYGNRCARWAERAYEHALRDGDARRVEEVRRVLAGASSSLGDYDLGGAHVAVVAAAGATVDASAALSVRAGDQRWLWAAPGTDLGLTGAAGVGGPAEGVDGFRRAHREALAALRVAERRGAPVRFREAPLEALALADPETARDFVDAELGPLLGDGTRESALRETLAAWFAAGQNVTAAATRLGLHERTVRNRLRAVERELGTHPAGRRAELETALRLLALREAP